MTPFGNFSHDFGFFQELPSELSFLFGILLLLFMLVSALKLWKGSLTGGGHSSRVVKFGQVKMKRKEVWSTLIRSRPSLSYYITFEVENGVSLELSVKKRDYGMIIEGDYGELIYQGDQLLEFIRDLSIQKSRKLKQSQPL
ncbi:DUF2500 domain-containing protein [Paenibacillus aquistagni]|uniref:DUF2500 domain-containing protein n=1 Tax=Paenibacillus aquistagni TaxID=1852522 RepID=A0A1X7ITE1_9BACL|nr:DUF2500 domain-containing protein [Paenibacillus aquistagni]NMM51072.1 DUF2500 family protein [Paenibacillus aquistagni]SMG18453.1 Protein of unknown function [Paenibacillus aquistagni]